MSVRAMQKKCACVMTRGITTKLIYQEERPPLNELLTLPRLSREQERLRKDAGISKGTNHRHNRWDVPLLTSFFGATSKSKLAM